MQYTIQRAKTPPALEAEWDDPALAGAPAASVAVFYTRPHSSDHRPPTEAKVLYDDAGLYVFFRVQDRYVRAIAERNQDQVCWDSCVEFFVQPRADRGYFNFEVNCGGVVLLYYIENPEVENGKFKQMVEVEPRWLDQIRVFHTLPRRVPEEIAAPVEWRVAYRVPFALFEHYAGPLAPLAGQTWRGNFYKCADRTSHPHWASWAPIEGKLFFHRPEFFQPLHFAAC